MSRFHTLTVADVRRETADAVSIAFAVPDAARDDYRFAQGQYLTLRATLGGEELRRSYSICSGLDDGELRIAVKKVDRGRFSAFVNDDLRPGDVLDVMTPMGRFTKAIDPTAAKTYVAFAAGSGITPILSILKSHLAREPKSRFVLFYGNRSVSSILFREEIEDLKNRHMTRLSVHHILSREKQDAALLNGRLDAAKIEALMGLVDPGAVDAYFLCGPAPMTEAATRVLAAKGIARERILTELFLAPDAPAPAKTSAPPAGPKRDGAARVTVVRDGVRTEFPVAFDGETILDAGNKRGLDLPFSCKGGVCSTCRCLARAGKVAVDKNFSLEPWELEAGYVLACQSRPASEEIVLDFDEV